MKNVVFLRILILRQSFHRLTAANKDLLAQCHQENMRSITRRRRWSWIGHVLRMEERAIPKTAVHLSPSAGHDCRNYIPSILSIIINVLSRLGSQRLAKLSEWVKHSLTGGIHYNISFIHLFWHERKKRKRKSSSEQQHFFSLSPFSNQKRKVHFKFVCLSIFHLLQMNLP